MKLKSAKAMLCLALSAFMLLGDAGGVTAYAAAEAQAQSLEDIETTEVPLDTEEGSEVSGEDSTEGTESTGTGEPEEGTEAIESTEIVEPGGENGNTESTGTDGAAESTESTIDNGETESTEAVEPVEEVPALETESTEEITESVPEETELIEETEATEEDGLQKEEKLLGASVTPGASFSTAQQVSLNTAYSATMTAAGYDHYYKFILPSQGLVTLNFQHVSGTDLSYKVYLDYKSNGSSTWDTYINSAESVKNRPLGLAAGTYYLYVDGGYLYGSENQTYTFTLNFTANSYSETEYNGDFANADAIPVNTKITGSTIASSDLDYYKFTLSAPGSVSFNLTHGIVDGREADDVYDVSFYNSATGNRLLYFESLGGETSKTSNIIGLPKGTYYVCVKAGYGNYDTGSYGLTVNYTASNYWEAETNDTFATANAVAVNQQYSGTIHGSGDEDYYKVTLAQAGAIGVNFTHPNIDGYETTLCFTLDIYSASNLTDSFYKMYIDGAETNMQTPQIGLAAGTYYVKIGGVWKYDGVYGLKVNYAASEYWEREENGTGSTATAIKSAKTYSGSIKDSSDEDYYKLSVGSNGYMTVNLKHSSSAADRIYTVRVYNSDFNVVHSFAVYGTDKNVTSCKLGVGKGTYYILVRPYGVDTGTYQLTATAKKASNWETEINDDRAGADKISLGKSVNGVNDDLYSGDYDYYKFTLSKATYVNFSLSHRKINGSGAVWDVTLFDSKGSRVSWGDEGYLSSKESAVYTESKATKLAKGTYYLRVQASGNGVGEEYELGLNKVTVKAPTISSVQSTQYNKIKVTWKTVAGAENYTIYRSTSKNGTYKKVKTISDTATTSWTDGSVKTGTTYYYKMKAKVTTNKATTSGYSKVKSAKCVPAKPAVTLNSSKAKQIKVSWKKVSGASGYEIYRATSKNGKYQKVTTVKKGSTTSYTNKKLTSKKTYYYKVRAYRTVNGKKVYSSYSSVVSQKAK